MELMVVIALFVVVIGINIFISIANIVDWVQSKKKERKLLRKPHSCAITIETQTENGECVWSCGYVNHRGELICDVVWHKSASPEEAIKDAVECYAEMSKLRDKQ